MISDWSPLWFDVFLLKIDFFFLQATTNEPFHKASSVQIISCNFSYFFFKSKRSYMICNSLLRVIFFNHLNIGRPYMTDYAGPQDYVENLQSSWMTSNILGTVLTVTQPHCESDDSTRIVLDPD